MRTNITATIQNQTITIYFGATLKNALLSVNECLYDKVINKEAYIIDQFGNFVDIYGAVDDGFTYRVIEV